MILDFIPLLVRLKKLNWYQTHHCNCFTSHCYTSILSCWLFCAVSFILFVSLVKLINGVLSTAFSVFINQPEVYFYTVIYCWYTWSVQNNYVIM